MGQHAYRPSRGIFGNATSLNFTHPTLNTTPTIKHNPEKGGDHPSPAVMSSHPSGSSNDIPPAATVMRPPAFPYSQAASSSSSARSSKRKYSAAFEGSASGTTNTSEKRRNVSGAQAITSISNELVVTNDLMRTFLNNKAAKQPNTDATERVKAARAHLWHVDEQEGVLGYERIVALVDSFQDPKVVETYMFFVEAETQDADKTRLMRQTWCKQHCRKLGYERSAEDGPNDH